MPLLVARGLELAYGSRPLLDGVDLAVEPGERVALLGRNGSGKSSLLRVLAGAEPPDGGERWLAPGMVLAELPQELPASLTGGVEEIVRRRATAERAPREDWAVDRAVSLALDGLGLEGERRFEELSGGMRRRTLLAGALAREPDLLLLDEPTNHLDLPAIEWLEERLATGRAALVFVTHDRGFLARLATRIVELDRGHLRSHPGGWERYQERRAAELAAEERAEARLDRELAKEEAWIRRGLEARRTRNQGRVRALERLRADRAARRERIGRAGMELVEAERSGKLVVELDGVSFRFPDGPTIVRDLTTTVLRGDRVGILGPNGSGKTTLLELMLGRRAPDTGTVRLGTSLEIAYHDQTRAALDEEATIIDNVGDGSDTIEVGGRRRHLIGYLGEFLFPPERCRSPVKALSGGERNRVLLARLFARPANLLVLDEPTNDLDLETLEVLEERLAEFQGTVLLVSHDRVFLDRVVTSTLVMEGDGVVGEYAGGYADWLEQRPAPATDEAPAAPREPAAAGGPRKSREARPRKLGYKESRELDALPARIEELESEQAALLERMADPELAREDPAALTRAGSRLKELEGELEAAYARWQELDARPR